LSWAFWYEFNNSEEAIWNLIDINTEDLDVFPIAHVRRDGRLQLKFPRRTAKHCLDSKPDKNQSNHLLHGMQQRRQAFDVCPPLLSTQSFPFFFCIFGTQIFLPATTTRTTV
jgi:hypothetical protein